MEYGSVAKRVELSEDSKSITVALTFLVDAPYKVKGVMHRFDWPTFLGNFETSESAGAAINAMSDIGRKNMVRDAAAGASDPVAARLTKAQNIQKGLLDLRGGGLEDVFVELRILVIAKYNGKIGDYKSRADMTTRVIGAIAGNIAGRKGVKASDTKAIDKIMASPKVAVAADAEMARLETVAQEIVDKREDLGAVDIDALLEDDDD